MLADRISPLRGSMMSDWLSRLRRHPADDRVARVLGAPLRIVRRRVARDDRVPEAGRFERRLPGLDAALHVRHPLRRRRRVDVEHDRLHRLGHRRVRILLLEPEALDDALAHRPVLVGAEVHELLGVEADALVEVARASSAVLGSFIMLWCTTTVPLDPRMPGRRAASAAAAAAAARIRRAARERQRRFDVDVLRERHRALEERAVGLHAAAADGAARRELRRTALAVHDERRDIDDRIAVGAAYASTGSVRMIAG